MYQTDVLKDLVKHLKNQIQDAKCNLAIAVKEEQIYGVYADCGASYQEQVVKAEVKLQTLIEQKIMIEKYRKKVLHEQNN